jgi:hypothetical protein
MMGRRRKFTVKKRPYRKAAKTNQNGPRKRKLNMRKLSSFEYYLKLALEDVEAGGTIFGNIYSKSTNLGIDEARKYVDILVEDGNIDEDKAREVIDLLNKFSKFR